MYEFIQTVSCFYVNLNIVGNMYSSLSVLLKTQVHIRVRFECTHCLTALPRLLTYYREEKTQCLFGKVLVLDNRGGVGRSEIPCHTLSSPSSYIRPTEFVSILRFYHLMQPDFFVLFWSTSYESSFPQWALRGTCICAGMATLSCTPCG